MTSLLRMLGCLLALGVFGVVVYLLLGWAHQRMQRLHDQVSPRFLRETVPLLLPWEPSVGLGDLSSLCRGRAEMSGWRRMYHARGTMQSCADRNQAWLAYTVNQRGRQGEVHLCTSKEQFLLEIRSDSSTWADRYASVTVNGGWLGRISLASREMQDALGRSLGRVTGGSLVTTYGTTNYRDVSLAGQSLAQINSNLLHPGQRLGPLPPAFLLEVPDVSPEEARWLLALLALELYQDRNRLNI